MKAKKNPSSKIRAVVLRGVWLDVMTDLAILRTLLPDDGSFLFDALSKAPELVEMRRLVSAVCHGAGIPMVDKAYPQVEETADGRSVSWGKSALFLRESGAVPYYVRYFDGRRPPEGSAEHEAFVLVAGKWIKRGMVPDGALPVTEEVM